MTFVIAKITDANSGAVTLLSDTKVTDRIDDTASRRTLSNPGQKVVIVDDDIVVGVAGDTPASAVNRVAELRGQSVYGIEDALRAFSAEMHETAGASKSFLVVARTPEPRITVISRGQQEDRTAIGTGWIGDREAFNAFSEVFQDDSAPGELGLDARFFFAMSGLIAWEDVDTVGGYLVRVSGRSDKPLRFMPDTGLVMPDDINGTIIHKPHGQATLDLSLADGADPTRHMRLPIPGTGLTYSALAHYIPEARTAWLHTHEHPGDQPKRLTVDSLSELVEVAQSKYGQFLDTTVAQRVLQGNHPPPSMLYMRPYPGNDGR
ncbi:hypothetical protein ACP6C7_09805 [Mycolicibacterium septicum]|uniref:Uncharacterized protein n=1 Tax=Mycolicibacterium septicum TaxID=98668 RepID=A0ABW9LXY1_9MYCO